MNRLTVAALLTPVLVIGLVLALRSNSPPNNVPVNAPSPSAAPSSLLIVACAASNRPVMELLRQDFTRETGILVEVQYGPSQGLLSGLELTRTGDVYLPADDSYILLAKDKGLIQSSQPVARMQVALAVKQGNPLKIQSLADLRRDDVRLVQANPKLAAVGKIVEEALAPQGLWEPLAARTQVFRTNVNEAANDVAVGAADVAISYDVVARAIPGLEAVRIPELDALQADVGAAVLTISSQPETAAKFVGFLTSSQGQSRYKKLGFLPPAANALREEWR